MIEPENMGTIIAPRGGRDVSGSAEGNGPLSLKSLMYRIWYIVGAVVIWAIVYQGFFRYEFTMKNGYAVQRYDRLTGKTCGIPECLPPTPSPVPKPTAFEPVRAYRDYERWFDREARQAVALVRKTALANDLSHARGADKFAWTVEWSDQVAGSLFVLHNPSDPHALPIDKRYIDSLDNPAYTVELVCFCNKDGAGFRWEVHLTTRDIYYVNDSPKLQKKYSLVDTGT